MRAEWKPSAIPSFEVSIPMPWNCETKLAPAFTHPAGTEYRPEVGEPHAPEVQLVDDRADPGDLLHQSAAAPSVFGSPSTKSTGLAPRSWSRFMSSRTFAR